MRRAIHHIRANLADGGVLVAGASAAADRADQFAALDQRKPAGARDQGRIERTDIAMSGFIHVIERARLPAETRRGASLAVEIGPDAICAPSIR